MLLLMLVKLVVLMLRPLLSLPSFFSLDSSVSSFCAPPTLAVFLKVMMHSISSPEKTVGSFHCTNARMLLDGVGPEVEVEVEAIFGRSRPRKEGGERGADHWSLSSSSSLLSCRRRPPSDQAWSLSSVTQSRLTSSFCIHRICCSCTPFYDTMHLANC